VAKKRKVAESIEDPTLPKTPVEIGGKTYNLCFTFGAIATAEHHINAEFARSGSPERVSLLVALNDLDLYNACILFAAGIHQFHPEIGFDEARKLVDYSSIQHVMEAIVAGFSAAMPDPEKKPANPPQPGA
jgi:hypothetical protein